MFTRRLNDRVELRLYEERFAEEVFRATDENREHLSPWMGWAKDVKSVDDTLAFIRKSLEQFARNDGFQASIWEDGRFVGGAGFISIDRRSDSTEIGYWIAKRAEGRGIITMATRALVDHAFDAWKLHKVVIRAAVGNSRSRAVPMRLGFTEEGTLRQCIKIGDTYHDAVVYGMLADEWQPLRNAETR
jgi:ribosomal-protein-serine acetyltransferase